MPHKDRNLGGRRDFTEAATGKGIREHFGQHPLENPWWQDPGTKPAGQWVWNAKAKQWWHPYQTAPFGQQRLGEETWSDVAPLDPAIFGEGVFVKAEGSHEREPSAHVTIYPNVLHHSTGRILASDYSTQSYTFGDPDETLLFPDEDLLRWLPLGPTFEKARKRAGGDRRRVDPRRSTQMGDPGQKGEKGSPVDRSATTTTTDVSGSEEESDPFDGTLAEVVARVEAAQAWFDSDEGRRFLNLPTVADETAAAAAEQAQMQQEVLSYIAELVDSGIFEGLADFGWGDPPVQGSGDLIIAGPLDGADPMHPTQKEMFAQQVLEGIGAPLTANNMMSLLAWMAGEGTKAANNPLATTQGNKDPELYGGGGENWLFNSSLVKNYPTFEDGVRATVDTINLPWYSAIRDALVEGTTPDDLEQLVVASSWTEEKQPGDSYFGSVTDASLGLWNAFDEGGRYYPLEGFQTGQNIPSGYEVYDVDGQYQLVYIIDPGMGVQAFVAFAFDEEYGHERLLLGEAVSMPTSQWQQMVEGNFIIEGGDTADLEGLGGRHWDDIIDEFLRESYLTGTDALSDRTIVNALGEYILRPDMSETELQALIFQSDWTQARTTLELEWGSFTFATQQQLILDEALQLATAWELSTGQRIDMSGITTVASLEELQPDLARWATDIASGTATEPMAVAQWISVAAAAIEDSPYNRKLTDEIRLQGQQAAITGDYRNQVVDLYNRYGITVSSADADDLAEKLYMNTDTMGDVTERVMNQSDSIYPHKPREVDFRTYAAPFANAYAMTLETTVPSFDDPMLAGHLTNPDAAPNLSAFRKELRSDPRWDTTLNARDQYFRSFDQVGRTMGLG